MSKLQSITSRPATISLSTRMDARHLATLARFWSDNGSIPSSTSELARPSQEWSNINRLGDLCQYPNALVWPSKLLEKSSALLDEKLSKLNLLRRLCKYSK